MNYVVAGLRSAGRGESPSPHEPLIGILIELLPESSPAWQLWMLR